METVVFKTVDCPEQIDAFGEVTIGLGVTVTFEVVTALAQLFKVYINV